MKFLLLVCSFIFICSAATAQTCQWAKSTSQDEILSSVTDSSGNLYVAGKSYGGSSSAGYIAKYNSDGICQWTEKITASKDDKIATIFVLNIVPSRNNSLYISGCASESSSILPSSITLNFNNNVSLANSNNHNFIAKYSTDGKCQWASKIYACINGINTDSSGNLFIAGAYYSSSVKLNNSITLYNSDTTRSVGFFAMYDSNGLCHFAKNAGTYPSSNNFSKFSDIAVDKFGAIYISGEYSYYLTLNNNISLSTISGFMDEFIAKFDANGLCQWAEQFSGITYSGWSTNNSYMFPDLIHSRRDLLFVDKRAANIYIAGSYTTRTPDFGNGVHLTNANRSYDLQYSQFNGDGFLAKYSSNGLCQWAQRIGGDTNDVISGICSDSKGNIYLSGIFLSTSLSFNNGISLSKHLADDYDAFFTKYDENGDCQWAQKIGGCCASDESSTISVDSHDNIYVAGSFYSPTLTFNNEVTLSGGRGYFAKYNLHTDLPNITTTPILSIRDSSAESGGIIDSDGGAVVKVRGVCWSSNGTPTTSDSKTSNGTGTGTFTSHLSGLSSNTRYCVRAYAINSVGTAYGNLLYFNTLPKSYYIPTIITANISSISRTSAISGGDISSDGGSAVSFRGVCWKTSSRPTINDNITKDGSGIGSFTSEMKNLAGNTQYYVRAYATNIIGTAYGNELQFTTLPILYIPTIVTTNISSISQTNAISGGDISSDGGSAVSARGVCWKTSSTPTITDNITSDGTSIGAFTSLITNLTANTLYYVRAYATNNIGTAYGNELQFTTLPIQNIPTIVTTNISSISQTNAISGGDISSDGGSAVSARGVCWKASSTPTITDNITSDGTSIGAFTSAIPNLTANTLYFVRAYATNTIGTAYGNELQFTTLPILYIPTITTTNISSISQTSAISGGDISSDGGSAVSSRGVCWKTSSMPTISDNITSDGTSIGAFTSAITNLTANTLYYVRAYATNNIGTAYGNELSFTTLDYGANAACLIKVDTAKGEIGIKSEIPIYLLNAKEMEYSGITAFDITLSFNGTVLYPLNATFGAEVAGRQLISFTAPYNSSSSDSVLYILKVLPVLGNAESTDVKIEKITPIGGSAAISGEDGEFTVLGICQSGGTRLIDASSAKRFLAIYPNPASEKVNIKFYSDTKEQIIMYICNELGEKVMDINAPKFDEVGLKELTIDVSSLNSGTYFLAYKTDKVFLVKKLGVSK